MIFKENIMSCIVNGLSSVRTGFVKSCHYCVEKAKSGVSKTTEVSKKVFSAILPMNPVTKNREFRIIPTCVENWIGDMYYDSVCDEMENNWTFRGTCSKYANNSKIKEIGRKLVEKCDRKELNFKFRVVNSDIVNAVCLPGGKIAITTGLLRKLDTDDEIAFVLGHEITHACAAHSAKSIQFGLMIWVVGVVMEVVAGVFVSAKLEKANADKRPEDRRSANEINDIARAVQWAVSKVFGIATFFVASKRSRTDEYQADRIGMKYAARAEYDPRAAIRVMEVFEKMNSLDKDSWAGKTVEVFQSHPLPDSRITACTKVADEIEEKGVESIEK